MRLPPDIRPWFRAIFPLIAFLFFSFLSVGLDFYFGQLTSWRTVGRMSRMSQMTNFLALLVGVLRHGVHGVQPRQPLRGSEPTTPVASLLTRWPCMRVDVIHCDSWLVSSVHCPLAHSLSHSLRPCLFLFLFLAFPTDRYESLHSKRNPLSASQQIVLFIYIHSFTYLLHSSILSAGVFSAVSVSRPCVDSLPDSFVCLLHCLPFSSTAPSCRAFSSNSSNSLIFLTQRARIRCFTFPLALTLVTFPLLHWA